MDLEAFSLQHRGLWLNDYKTLKVNNIRSGDELSVVIKVCVCECRVFVGRPCVRAQRGH